jgi:transcriptional regulator with XRE-family HTH domain
MMNAKTAATAETIAQRLRRLRLERGMSQRELAEPGVSYAYISRIEAGQRQPSVKALRKLAAKLGVPSDFLESGEQPIDNRYVLTEVRRAIQALEREQASEAQRRLGELERYLTDQAKRIEVVAWLAAQDEERRELEQLRAKFSSDEQMRGALGDQLADQVVQKLGERADELTR